MTNGRRRLKRIKFSNIRKCTLDADGMEHIMMNPNTMAGVGPHHPSSCIRPCRWVPWSSFSKPLSLTHPRARAHTHTHRGHINTHVDAMLNIPFIQAIISHRISILLRALHMRSEKKAVAPAKTKRGSPVLHIKKTSSDGGGGYDDSDSGSCDVTGNK